MCVYCRQACSWGRRQEPESGCLMSLSSLSNGIHKFFLTGEKESGKGEERLGSLQLQVFPPQGRQNQERGWEVYLWPQDALRNNVETGPVKVDVRNDYKAELRVIRSILLRYQFLPLGNLWWFLSCKHEAQPFFLFHAVTVPFDCLSSVQLLSRVRLFATPWIASCQASLSITNSRSSLKLTSIKSVMPSSHLILCRPLLLLPQIPPSSRVFSSESTLRMRWPKYWSFSFSIIPSKEHPGLISFRMDLLDLLAVQGTLKSLLQLHSSKASILQCSAFFTVLLSHPYMTTGKTIALTRRIFVGKIMSLLFNMLSRLVITFLPRSKRLLISWLQSPSAVILSPQK